MKRGLIFATSLLALFATGCADEIPDAPSFTYPRDAELRVNHLQTKGTHNSYHVAAPDAIKPLAYTHAPLDVQLRDQGVRQFELDTRYNYVEERFEVFHIGTIDEGTTCRLFVDCLAAIRSWSRANPAHHPIFVQIEPKEDPAEVEAEDYFAKLEGEILSRIPRDAILTPDDVKGDAPSVREAIVTNGWPVLGKARGKIIFFVDNSGGFRTFYTHGDASLDGRLMFIDADLHAPYAGVILANDPIGDIDRIVAAVSAGLIVRTRADGDNIEPFAGDTTRRDEALKSGAQLVSTDYPVPVDGVDYVVEIPGGTPSRCNPVTAPIDELGDLACASEDIEDPRFIDAP